MKLYYKEFLINLVVFYLKVIKVLLKIYEYSFVFKEFNMKV